MPVKLMGKKYKNHASATKAVKKKKGLSTEKANAYVAVVERKQKKSKKKSKK